VLIIALILPRRTIYVVGLETKFNTKSTTTEDNRTSLEDILRYKYLDNPRNSNFSNIVSITDGYTRIAI